MRQAVIVCGAKWGDEGKGHIVEALAKHLDASIVVRDVGGAQAAHHVVLQNGISHRFQQFGAATFQGVPTFLSQHFVVDPFELEREAEELQSKGVENPYDLMYIHEDALMATPMHKYGDDQWREKNPSVSTCGMGVGEARWLSDAKELRLDVYNATALNNCTDALRYIQGYYETDYNVSYMAEQIWTIMRKIHVIDDIDWQLLRNFSNVIIFEGAQGALLDCDLGDKPYVTSSKTDYSNALELLQDYNGKITRIAVMRSYETRHGAGSFPVEAPEMLKYLPEMHNQNNEFQGDWRVAPFNLEATKRGLEILKDTDCIAMTHLDKLHMIPFNIPEVQAELGVPIGITSFGPTLQDVSIDWEF